MNVKISIGLVLVVAAGGLSSARAAEGGAGCSRDWKSYVSGLAADGRDPAQKLSELSSAWLDEYVCAQKKAVLAPACAEGAPKKAAKKACGEVTDRLYAAYDGFDDIVAAAREEERSSAEAGRSGQAADLADGWWSAADSADGFGKGVQRLVHWYHRQAGAALDETVGAYEKMRRRQSKIDQDLDDAYQLSLTKEQQKALKQERKELSKEMDAKERAMKAERKRFAKATSSALDKWEKSFSKELKARKKSKDLCACVQ